MAPPEVFSTPGHPGEADDFVSFVSELPLIQSLQTWLSGERFKRRGLRWVSAGGDYIYFADELWSRDILLPARHTGGGVAVVPENGAEVILRRDWEYWIEGHQDDLVISGGGFSLVVREDSTGYVVNSAQLVGQTGLA